MITTVHVHPIVVNNVRSKFRQLCTLLTHQRDVAKRNPFPDLTWPPTIETLLTESVTGNRLGLWTIYDFVIGPTDSTNDHMFLDRTVPNRSALLELGVINPGYIYLHRHQYLLKKDGEIEHYTLLPPLFGFHHGYITAENRIIIELEQIKR